MMMTNDFFRQAKKKTSERERARTNERDVLSGIIWRTLLLCISSNNMLSASSYRQRANEREREWYYPQNLMLVVRVLFFFASYLVVVSIEYCLFDETEIRAFAAVLVFSLSPPLRRLGLGFIHVYIYIQL